MYDEAKSKAYEKVIAALNELFPGDEDTVDRVMSVVDDYITAGA